MCSRTLRKLVRGSVLVEGSGQTHFWANFEHSVLPEEHASSSCGNGVDIQLRTLDRYTSRHSLKDKLEGSAVPADICGCSTNVKADNGRLTIVRRPRVPYNTT